MPQSLPRHNKVCLTTSQPVCFREESSCSSVHTHVNSPINERIQLHGVSSISSQHMTDSNTARKRQGVVPDSHTRRDLHQAGREMSERSPEGDVLVLSEKSIYELRFLPSY